jgi:hypothetical protein
MVDCGGGTIDITSHIIASGGAEADGPLCLNELVPPMGGNWGSLGVDDNFLSMIIKPLLGTALFSKLCSHTSVKHQLMEEFETKLKKPHTSKVRGCRRLNISLLDSLFEGENNNKLITNLKS